jgi:hypothetical protein
VRIPPPAQDQRHEANQRKCGGDERAQEPARAQTGPRAATGVLSDGLIGARFHAAASRSEMDLMPNYARPARPDSNSGLRDALIAWAFRLLVSLTDERRDHKPWRCDQPPIRLRGGGDGERWTKGPEAWTQMSCSECGRAHP